MNLSLLAAVVESTNWRYIGVGLPKCDRLLDIGFHFSGWEQLITFVESSDLDRRPILALDWSGDQSK